MVLWLKALVALSEDLGSVSSHIMVVHNHPQLQFQEVEYLLLISVGLSHVYGAYAYIHLKQRSYKSFEETATGVF